MRTEFLQSHFLKEGRLETSDAIRICFKAGEIMKKEPNLLRIRDPVTSKTTKYFFKNCYACYKLRAIFMDNTLILCDYSMLEEIQKTLNTYF